MKVNTERLEEQASGLRVIAYRMREIQDSVLRTSGILSRESVGEQFRIPIQNAAASVEKRYEELMRMQSTLRDIANIYERNEQEILDEAEHANVHYDFNPIRTIVLPVLNVVEPNLGRGLNPVLDIQLPDPINVDELFRTEGNGGIQAAPGMSRGIESNAQPVGYSTSSPEASLGSSSTIDWTPWNP